VSSLSHSVEVVPYISLSLFFFFLLLSLFPLKYVKEKVSTATLAMSIIYSQFSMVETLLKHGMSPNKRCTFYKDFAFSDNVVPDWMKAGVDIYPAHLAIVYCHKKAQQVTTQGGGGGGENENEINLPSNVECLTHLMLHGLDVSKVCSVGRSFLTTAVEVKNRLALRRLLEYAFKKEEQESIHHHINKSESSKKEESSNFKTSSSNHHGFSGGSSSGGDALCVDAAADITVLRCPKDQLTALLLASMMRDVYAVQMILKYSTQGLQDKLYFPPSFNFTPLFIAAHVK
jgi:hypothetical protein